MPDLDRRVEQIRHFNRFYTREIGVLNEGLLQSPFSLTESRILYEIAHRPEITANQLCRELVLDPGYVSRILAGFRKRGLVEQSRSAEDRRRQILTLTTKGRAEFAWIDRGSHEEIRAKLGRLSTEQRRDLVQSMERIEGILSADPSPGAPYVLRPHEPGDMGWVVYRHGALYAQEYGWDASFEALVAGIVSDFIKNLDPARERCWIAERNGDRLGSIFLVRKTDCVAKLRLLLVEPSARGCGLGRHLVHECLRFARQAGYRKVVLWTNSVLHAARHLYEEAGFRLADEEKFQGFGKDLTSQTWELHLGAQTRPQNKSGSK